MTQLDVLNPAKPRTKQKLEVVRPGPFLVKPMTASRSTPVSEPRIAKRSRSVGLPALVAAALAAPLLWFLHQLLTSGH